MRLGHRFIGRNGRIRIMKQTTLTLGKKGIVIMFDSHNDFLWFPTVQRMAQFTVAVVWLKFSLVMGIVEKN